MSSKNLLTEFNCNPIKIESQEINECAKTLNFSSLLPNSEKTDFNIIHFIVFPGNESIMDQHQSKEYWFIMGGEGRLMINEKSFDVKKGELYFFNSMEKHKIENLGNQDLEILSIWW